MPMIDPFYLSAGSILATAFGTAIVTTWRVGRMLDARDSKLIELMRIHELADTERFSAVRSEVRAMGETVRHETGESNAAIRQKMHDMEMWGRDNNLGKRTFETVMGDVKESIRAVAEKVDSVIMRNSGVDRKPHQT